MAFTFRELCAEARFIFEKVDPKSFEVQNWLKELDRTIDNQEVAPHECPECGCGSKSIRLDARDRVVASTCQECGFDWLAYKASGFREVDSRGS